MNAPVCSPIHPSIRGLTLQHLSSKSVPKPLKTSQLRPIHASVRLSINEGHQSRGRLQVSVASDQMNSLVDPSIDAERRHCCTPTLMTICMSRICAWSGSFVAPPFGAPTIPPGLPGAPIKPGVDVPSRPMSGTMLALLPPFDVVDALNRATYSNPWARSVARIICRIEEVVGLSWFDLRRA